MAGLRFSLLSKSREIRLLDVIQEAGDALIYGRPVRQAFELWIEEPAKLKTAGKRSSMTASGALVSPGRLQA